MALKSKIKKKVSRLYYGLQNKQFIHFLHIGKTGGTAVKHALRPHLVSADHVVYLSGHKVRLRDVPEGEKVFFFLRDPVSRFVSGFYSRQRQGQPRIFNPWTPVEKIAFDRFRTPNELACALSSNDDELKLAAEHAMKSIGHVKSSFWDWFESEAYFISRRSDILFVGFQESLDRDIQTLKAKLGIAVDLRLPDDDAQAHRTPSDLDIRLEPVAVENLKRWFEAEYGFIELSKRLLAQETV